MQTIDFRCKAAQLDSYIYFVTHVLHMDTTIRNIDPFVYKRLKEKAAAEGISIGEAVTKAISEWLGLAKKKKKSILDIKPEHFGYQYRNLSEEIDEVLYGEEKA